MLDITNSGQIKITRGDSFYINLFINKGTRLVKDRYVLQEGDKVYFGVMEPNQDFECALIKKTLTSKNFNNDEDVKVEFVVDDTINLLPGTYYYEVKLEFNNGKSLNTIIPKTKFIIL